MLPARLTAYSIRTIWPVVSTLDHAQEQDYEVEDNLLKHYEEEAHARRRSWWLNE